MNMKIGIITLPLLTNYGGLLQAYALQKILHRLGYEVETLQIPYKKRLSTKRLPFVYAKRIIKKYILRQPKTLIFEEYWWNQYGIPTMSLHTKRFLNTYVKIRYIHKINDIHPRDYEIFIVGSDQIFRPKYFNLPIQTAYLSFTKNWNVKRVAYAASFGTDDWEYTSKQTKECAQLAKLFDFISVRESSAISICKEKLGVNANLVLDPTMLLQTQDYIALFESNNTPKSKGNMHCYILDETPEKQSLIDNIAKEKGLKPFSILKSVKNPYANPNSLIQPPVEQWLRAFYDSDFIVTDSFHACVFSILFRKQFIVYGNINRGMTRLHSILSLFGLEDRLVYNYEHYRLLKQIEYDKVFEKLDKMRAISISYLKKLQSF